MHRSTRSSSFISMTIGGLLAVFFGGCAHELAFSDTDGRSASLAAFGERADPNTPRSPSAVCDQYLALLSEERAQTPRQRYGTDGQCWSGDSAQQRACEGECRGLTYSLIKSSLAQMESEKQQASESGTDSSTAQE